MKVILATIIITVLLSAAVLGHVDAKSKDSKAKDAIIKALGKAVEGKYSKIDLMSVSKLNDSSSVFFYNKTKGPITPPVPVPIPCPTGSVVINGGCVPPTPSPPNPPPLPTGEVTTICLAGDLSGNAVPSAMKDCNMKIGLGDLGYKSDLSYFKGLKFDKCVIGNHDALEDGSSAIYQEALAYCGDHWSLKTANNTVLILGFNTNSDPSIQISWAKSIMSDSKNMQNVKTVIVISHKNGHVFPNAHHPAEAKSLYSQIEQIQLPTGVKLFEISGHNHDLAQGGNWYIAGAGGRSHYACGTDALWTFCNNSNYGYLKLTIDNKNGAITSAFYDTNNKKLN